MTISIFGIRHHGQGCARSLHAALPAFTPDIVLVEGPPDAQEILPFMHQAGMEPPVAIMIYASDQPKHAVYYPFVAYSPEWQALAYAHAHAIPARFMDLPQAITLGLALGRDAEVAKDEENTKGGEKNEEGAGEEPLQLLAQAAGYSDYDLWWEHMVEQRRDSHDLFAAILEAMSALRTDTTPKNAHEAEREAAMRQAIRMAQKEGFQRIAVVCGAWHAPVLVDQAILGLSQQDQELLSGLKKVKVEATWIPWNNMRLTYRSGYGAGISSPGWYEHLWTTGRYVSESWLTRAAHNLREQGLDTSSANVIEATRLAEALAALRGMPMPGQQELHEAMLTTLCHGDSTPMKLIRDQLEVGDRLGQVPADVPTVPIQRDLETQQRQLRLKPSVEITRLELDLRREVDRARSQLLHRLTILHISWGSRQRVSGKAGTFHEFWQIQWQVEFAIALIEANIWGNTVEAAADAALRQQADATSSLPELTNLFDQAILAELPRAIDHLLATIQQRAAIAADLRHLMDALPALARVARYGNVRGTKTEHIEPIIRGLCERILVGLPAACSSLDDDAAALMIHSITNVHESLHLLQYDDLFEAWLHTLSTLMLDETLHGLLRGRSTRLLLEQQRLSDEELHQQTRLALSPVQPVGQAAAWIEGVVQGSGLLLLHQDMLWKGLDRWLSGLSAETFVQLLPLLRRAFAGFQPPERRAMGEKVKRLYQPESGRAGRTDETHTINQHNAERVLPVLAQILGLSSTSVRR
jgi:hypothetical protein